MSTPNRETATPNEVGTSTNFKGANRSLAAAIVTIIAELQEYWPLTVRQVYYQCVSRLLIANHINEYKRVSRLLVKLRETESVPWRAIEDRTRRTVDKRGVPSVREFIEEQLEYFLNHRFFHRCYLQDQSVYAEVASEKDALAGILEEAVWPYCTRLNIVRGQVSASMVEKMAERFRLAALKGQECVLVHLGDFDYSGVAIPKALRNNLAERHGVQVRLMRAALNPEQIGP